MAHARTTIREAVAALLAAAGTAASTRVYESPNEPRSRFPALVVCDPENGDVEDQGATTLPGGPDRTIERRYRFDVRCEVQQNSGFAAARDSLAAEVETEIASALINSPALSGVKQITPAGFDVRYEQVGEHPITVGIQHFTALYFTRQGAPGVFI